MTSKLRPCALLFDLDGTLLDPFEGIVGCYREALADLGYPVATDEDLAWVIGPPIRDAFGEIHTQLIRDSRLTQAHQSLSAKDWIEAGVASYRKFYADHGQFQNNHYPHIPETIQALSRKYELYVATSKPQVYAQQIIEHFGFAPYFRAVHGPDLSGLRSEKPELLAHIQACEDLDPKRTVMIGDRKFDVAGARAIGAQAISVAWGYGTQEELALARADRMVTTPQELARAIQELLPDGAGILSSTIFEN